MKKLTTEEFIKKAKNIKPNYDFSKVEYMGANVKVKITCDKGHEFEIAPSNFMNSKGCAICTLKRRTLTTKEFIKRAKEIKPNYNFSKVEYVNAKTKVKVTCEKSHEFEIRPGHLLSGIGCTKCSRRYRCTTKEWIVEAKKIKPFYDFNNVEYVRSHTKVKITCEKGHEFKISPANFMSGKGCAKCSSSKGEEKIRDFLNENNVLFLEQKRFDDCKCKNSLPFDFYIPSHNICIEYDGEQHHNPIYFGSRKDKTKEEVKILAENKLKKIQARDAIKTKYCKENNINLIRIPYTEFDNISSILNKSLNCF